MTAQLWSPNALSEELGIDPRSLSRRLARLPPAQERKSERGIERRWRLADVVHHLYDPDPSEDHDAEILAGLKTLIGGSLYPGLLCSRFTSIFTAAMREEFQLTKAQAARAYQIACYAIVSGLCEHLNDEEMVFTLPEHVQELGELGPEGYVKRRWPDLADEARGEA